MKILISIFQVTALVTHLWTVVIAFQESGLVGGLISLFLPVLSELYWMIVMFGENNVYSVIALIHAILVLPMYLMKTN